MIVKGTLEKRGQHNPSRCYYGAAITLEKKRNHYHLISGSDYWCLTIYLFIKAKCGYCCYKISIQSEEKGLRL